MMPAHGVGASRIIPARAGFTSSSGPCSRTRTDHPRSRGVYVDAHARKADLTGIIPARAGFTGTGSTCPPTGMDHPRSHGVYFDPAPGRHSVPGSSPLARGLRSLLLSSRSGPRIIPARAGFTSRRRCDRQREGDHPRSRGVYVRRSPWSSGAGGSSPLARGLLDHVVQEQDGPGIIPARAGFTSIPRPGAILSPDHPRSRGVYDLSFSLLVPVRGSSPLARGLLPGAGVTGNGKGIIPARAGFTCAAARGRAGREDHPRSRGVYSITLFRNRTARGSSPLARGLR